MEFTAQAIAEFLEGTIEGDPTVKVNAVAKIEEGKSGALSFLSNPKYSKYIYTTEASIVLINSDFILENPVKSTLIRVPDAYEAFAKLLRMVDAQNSKKPQGIHPRAFVESSSQIHETVYVGPLAYVGANSSLAQGVQVHPNAYIGNNVTIGANTMIYGGAYVGDGCVVGNNCEIHMGAVLGSDGFGYAPQPNGSYEKIPQMGNVVVEDNVSIGANTTIDRATMGSTIIRKGVKLDNLIQVAHNVEIGENTVIAAQTGIAGSSKIGKNCMFAGQVGVAGHITIADGVKLLAQAGVPNHIKEPNEILMGTPTMNARNYSRSYVHFKNLPEIVKEIGELKKKMNK